MHLAGHIWPTGRVLETPALVNGFDTITKNKHFCILIKHENFKS
jgi:hypothetical protein